VTEHGSHFFTLILALLQFSISEMKNLFQNLFFDLWFKQIACELWWSCLADLTNYFWVNYLFQMNQHLI